MTEKQKLIVEMAKDICRVKLNCNDVCNPISACDALKYAERAVEAGYRPQSEGEWEKPSAYSDIICSQCKRPPKIMFGVAPLYCPNCGAKMKGYNKK